MPAHEQLNVRVSAATKVAFRERARREGLTHSELLDAMLAMPLPARPEADPYEQAGPQPQALVRDAPIRAEDDRRVDFPAWLSGKAQVPKALAASAVRGGRVLVAGVAYTAQDIPVKLLKTTVVVYEGREL